MPGEHNEAGPFQCPDLGPGEVDDGRGGSSLAARSRLTGKLTLSTSDVESEKNMKKNGTTTHYFAWLPSLRHERERSGVCLHFCVGLSVFTAFASQPAGLPDNPTCLQSS